MGNVNKIQHKPKYMVITSFNNTLYKKQSNIYQLAKSVNKKSKKNDETLINIAFEVSWDVATKICWKTWNNKYIRSKSEELIQENKTYEEKSDFQKQLFRINGKKQFFNIVFEQVKKNDLTVLFFEEYERIPNELKLELIDIPKRDIIIMGAKNSGKSTFVDALKTFTTSSGYDKEDPSCLKKLATQSIEIPVIFYNFEHNMKYKCIIDSIFRTCIGNTHFIYDDIKNIVVSYLKLATIEYCKLVRFKYKSKPCRLNIYEFNCDDVILNNAEMIKKYIQCSFKTTQYPTVILFFIDISRFDKLKYSMNACNNLYSELTDENMWDFQVFLTKQDVLKENMDYNTYEDLFQHLDQYFREMIQPQPRFPWDSHFTQLINNEYNFMMSFHYVLKNKDKVIRQYTGMYYDLKKLLNGEKIYTWS
eukprot:546648_1